MTNKLASFSKLVLIGQNISEIRIRNSGTDERDIGAKK
jgi:hypothetical protein